MARSCKCRLKVIISNPNDYVNRYRLFLSSSVTLDPDTLALVNSLPLYARPALLSLTASVTLDPDTLTLVNSLPPYARPALLSLTASVTLDPDTLPLVNSLPPYARPALLSLTGAMKERHYPHKQKSLSAGFYICPSWVYKRIH